MIKTDQIAKALLKIGLKVIAPGFSDLVIATAGEAGNLLIDANTQARAAKVADRLLASIQDSLQSFARSEQMSDVDAERLMNELRNLVERRAPLNEDWVQAGFDASRLSRAMLQESRAMLDDMPPGDEKLLTQLSDAYYACLASESDTLARLEADFRSAVIAQLDSLPAKLALATGEEANRMRIAAAVAMLAIPRRPWRPGISPPGALLRADIEGPVPFHGRDDELTSLAQWCEQAGPLAVRLYTGAGGMGKSRLLIEASARQSKIGWRAGFLNRSAGALSREAYGALLDAGDVLVVVDYAETRRSELRQLLEEAFAVRRAARIRVVLLARSAEDWWDQLRAEGDGVADLLGGPATSWISLRPLNSDDAHREASYRTALEHFSRRLGRTADPSLPPDLADAHYGIVLLLHMRALAGVEGVAVKGEQGILDYVLDRERRFWIEAAHVKGVPDVLTRAIGQAMGAVTLGGGVRDRDDAVALFQRIALLEDQTLAVKTAVADLLHELYPGESWIEPIQPDLLGEHLVQAELATGSEELLELVFGARPES